jgi:hypothetical protein
MWAIWNSRNSWTHDNGPYDPVHSIKMAKEALAVLEIPKSVEAMLPGYGWRPPDCDVVKINTDAGISLEDRKGGGGGVARSHDTFWERGANPMMG